MHLAKRASGRSCRGGGRWIRVGILVFVAFTLVPVAPWAYAELQWSMALEAANEALHASARPRAIAEPEVDGLYAEPWIGPRRYATDAYDAIQGWIWTYTEARPSSEPVRITRELEGDAARSAEVVRDDAILLSLLHAAARSPNAGPKPGYYGVFVPHEGRDRWQLSLRHAARHYAVTGQQELRTACFETLLQVYRDTFDHDDPIGPDLQFEVVAHALAEALDEHPLPPELALRLARFSLAVDADWPLAEGRLVAFVGQSLDWFVEGQRAFEEARAQPGGPYAGDPGPHPELPEDHDYAPQLNSARVTNELLDLAANVSGTDSLPWPEVERRIRGLTLTEEVEWLVGQESLVETLAQRRRERAWLRVIVQLLHLHAGEPPPMMQSPFGNPITIARGTASTPVRIDAGDGIALEFARSVVRAGTPR